MEEGIFNLERIKHESVATTWEAEIYRRWRTEGCHEQQVLRRFVKVKVPGVKIEKVNLEKVAKAKNLRASWSVESFFKKRSGKLTNSGNSHNFVMYGVKH